MTRIEWTTAIVMAVIAIATSAVIATHNLYLSTRRDVDTLTDHVTRLQEEVIFQRGRIESLERVQVDVVWYVECDNAV